MRKQLELNLSKGRNGGRRPGSGRKRLHSKGISHKKREKVTHKTPLHINFKYKLTIRSDNFCKILEKAIQNAEAKDFIVAIYTIQHNHVHIIAETENNKRLSSGMKSLTRTIVKLLGKGSVQLERYHLHVLKSPQETKRAVEYVLYNDLKHTGRMDRKFTKVLGKGKSWFLTSSLKDIASEASPKHLYP